MFNKLLSGRFLVTIAATGVFAYLSFIGKMPVDKVHEIILIVVYAYFNRNDRNKGATNG